MEFQQPAPPTGVPARCPLYDQDFAADPQGVYDKLRAAGPAAPVELVPGVDATLVIDYQAARTVLQNTTDFSRDPHHWKALAEGRIAPDHPVIPMMAGRGNVMFADGAVHLRLRKAVTESLDRLNVRRIRRDVEPIAAHLIDQFSERGRADLLNDYAKLLPLLLFNSLFGCPGHIGDQVTRTMSAIFEGRDALRANEELTTCLMELIALKRREPGDDVTSWLIQHPAGLTDQELVDHLVLLMGAGVEPERNLIGNALLLLLSRGSSDRGAGMLIEEALDHVLWHNPPIANYATHYPLRDIDLGGVHVEADTPLVISFGAANNDPALRAARQSLSKGAHLAWGAGPHACPAKSSATVIAQTAIEAILNALPDLALDVPEEELQWRPGPFHRALATLPVRFTPTPGTRVAALARTQAEATTAPRPPRVPATPSALSAPSAPAPAHHQKTTPARKGLWSTFLDIFRV